MLVFLLLLKADRYPSGRNLADLLFIYNTMPPKTSGKAAVKSGKAAKAVPKGEKKKKKGKRKESYAIYIYKVCVENYLP